MNVGVTLATWVLVALLVGSGVLAPDRPKVGVKTTSILVASDGEMIVIRTIDVSFGRRIIPGRLHQQPQAALSPVEGPTQSTGPAVAGGDEVGSTGLGGEKDAIRLVAARYAVAA